MSALAHPVTWQAPRPLWRGVTPFSAAPQILRFASDDFMDQLLATLAEEPARISDRIAVPETWRDPPQPADRTDPIQRVPLPAPMKEAKRSRFLRSAASAPPVADKDRLLKLYQPAHQRYYVVTGTLACAVPGLPERALAGGHETVHFVLRRLLPADEAAQGDQTLVEYAYVREGDESRWQRVASSAVATDSAVLAPGEDLLPLFPLQHRDEAGTSRTIWSGLIPVARREEYLAKDVSRSVMSLAMGQRLALAPQPAPAPAGTITARTTQLRMEVMEPWKAMVRAATKAASEFTTDDELSERPGRIANYNYLYQHQSWLLLLDLSNWIAQHLEAVDRAIRDGTQPSRQQDTAVVTWLKDATVSDELVATIGDPDKKATSLFDALQKIRSGPQDLEDMPVFYPAAAPDGRAWPTFHFPLAGLVDKAPDIPPVITDGPFRTPTGTSPDDLKLVEASPILSPSDSPGGNPDADALDKVTALLARALVADATAEAKAPPLPHAMKLRDMLVKTAGDQGRFVLRMVHINADCGPLHPPTLSARSQEFTLASFFDPDAPVRPITITLPSDTSPAGLRKHGRGAAFVMSDLLCGQVQRAKGLGLIDLVLQVLPWPFHKEIDVGDGGGCKGSKNGPDIGMICSLSIPIITLCALILLIIMVSLLDFIFRWLPWFIMCFPVPKLKGKPS